MVLTPDGAQNMLRMYEVNRSFPKKIRFDDFNDEAECLYQI